MKVERPKFCSKPLPSVVMQKLSMKTIEQEDNDDSYTSNDHMIPRYKDSIKSTVPLKNEQLKKELFSKLPNNGNPGNTIMESIEPNKLDYRFSKISISQPSVEWVSSSDESAVKAPDLDEIKLKVKRRTGRNQMVYGQINSCAITNERPFAKKLKQVGKPLHESKVKKETQVTNKIIVMNFNNYERIIGKKKLDKDGLKSKIMMKNELPLFKKKHSAHNKKVIYFYIPYFVVSYNS